MNKSCDNKSLLILTTTWPAPEGAVPGFVADLVDGYVTDYNVVVISPASSRGAQYSNDSRVRLAQYRYWPFHGEKVSDGAILPNLRRNPVLWIQVPFMFVSSLFATLRACISHRPSLIHAHWLIPQGLVAILAIRLVHRRCKILVTAHGADIFGLKSLNWLKRWVLRNVDLATVVSEAGRRHLVELSGCERIKVQPMGVALPLKDAELVPDLAVRSKKFLFVGRLTEKKGVRYLLEAIRYIADHRARRDVYLDIFGEGEERAYLERLVVEYEIAAQVQFHGWATHDQLVEIYERSAFFVAPFVESDDGDQEGFGLVVAEAMSSGCLVITTDLPAVDDLVSDGVTGIRVRQKDPEALAEVIEACLDGGIDGQKIASVGLRYARDRFSIEAARRAYLGMIKELIE